MTAYLRDELAARGVRRSVVAGDLNMPNPREFFGETLRLVDAFGDPPLITTPDGRSIDRLFSTPDLVARDVEVVQVPGADHFPVVCRLTRRQPEAPAIGRIREQDLTRPPARSAPPERLATASPADTSAARQDVSGGRVMHLSVNASARTAYRRCTTCRACTSPRRDQPCRHQPDHPAGTTTPTHPTGERISPGVVGSPLAYQRRRHNTRGSPIACEGSHRARPAGRIERYRPGGACRVRCERTSERWCGGDWREELADSDAAAGGEAVAAGEVELVADLGVQAGRGEDGRG